MTTRGAIQIREEPPTDEAGAIVQYEKVSGSDVIWKPDQYNLDYVMKNFKAPFLVKVIEGLMIDEDNVLESGEILTIHGEIRAHQIEATDQLSTNHRIPIECFNKVVIRTFSDETYKTIRDICYGPKLPRMVRNKKKFTFYNETFNVGSQFEIIEVYKENNIPMKLRVIALTPKRLRISLPLSVRGDFTEALSPTDREKEYLIKDLTDREFPICIGFLPTTDKSCLYGPHLGRVLLHRLISVDMITATAHEVEKDSYKTFSRRLDATVAIGLVVQGPHGYADVSHTTSKATDVYVRMNSRSDLPTRDVPPIKGKVQSFSLTTESERNTWCSKQNDYEEDRSLPPFDIKDILSRLGLKDYVMAFEDEQIDASLATSLTEEHFISELKMTPFEATKLCMYIGGWRPMTSTFGSRQVTEMNPLTWPVEEVCKRMVSIKMPSFADFCCKNQVDGPLLKKIVNQDMLKSIIEKHNVAITRIEEKKLEQYVNGWRPICS